MAQENNKILDVRVILKGKIAKEFLAIKNYYGMEARTDFIRFLIHEKYEALKYEIAKTEKGSILADQE